MQYYRVLDLYMLLMQMFLHSSRWCPLRQRRLDWENPLRRSSPGSSFFWLMCWAAAIFLISLMCHTTTCNFFYCTFHDFMLQRVTWPEIFSRLLYNHMSSLHGETLGAGAPWCYESIYVIRSRKFLRQVVIIWVWWCFLSNFIFWQLATPSVDLPTRSYFTHNLTAIHSTRGWWKKLN